MVLICTSPMTSHDEQFFLYARWPFVCLENVCPAIRPFSNRAVYFCAVELCGLLTLGPEPVWDARAADRPLCAAGRLRGPSTVPSPGRGFGSTQPHTFLLLSPVLLGSFEQYRQDQCHRAFHLCSLLGAVRPVSGPCLSL